MSSTRCARLVFLAAGVYGVIAVVPGFFEEKMLNRLFPPALTHPEFFYGFFGVALAWQVAFFIIAGDPLRLRPIICAAIVEKLAYTAACAVLLATGRLTSLFAGTAAIDLVFAILFAVAYSRLGKAESAAAVAS